MNIRVINGPNLNMLGIREPDIYGGETYEDLCRKIWHHCGEKGIEAEIYQSNHEGEIVDFIQSAYKKADAIVINPAAYTHTSVAILDALKAVGLPTVEVHISDIDTREEFRRFSYVSLYAEKVFKGKGFESYKEAIVGIIDEIEKNVYSRQSVDSLCIKLKYSRAYLSKIFRQINALFLNNLQIMLYY